MKLFTPILISTLLFLAACHKSDDDAFPTPPRPSKIQIMTVFAPGQLGDQGYADRVMKGVNALQGDTTVNADILFMTSYDIGTLQQTLLTWAEADTAANDGTPYSRRLLVMTELYMAKWFSAMTGALRDGDEILLLKANENDVKTAAQILNKEIPVYGINISAASAVREYVEAYLGFLESCNQTTHPRNIGFYRLYSQETGLYRDSIAETIQETLNLAAPANFKNILTQEGLLYDTEMAGSAFEQAYMTCATELMKRSEDDPYDLFSILDFGSSNSGATFFLMARNGNFDLFPLMLDAEPRNTSNTFAIVRHFDRAIETWIRQWFQQQPFAMPQSETHGGWDGYCDLDIDKVEILFKIAKLTGQTL